METRKRRVSKVLPGNAVVRFRYEIEEAVKKNPNRFQAVAITPLREVALRFTERHNSDEDGALDDEAILSLIEDELRGHYQSRIHLAPFLSKH